MDLFTEKANSILKEMKPAETVVYNSAEENEEDDGTGDDNSIDSGALNAVTVAQKLATSPGVTANIPFIGAQSKMNSAYGNLMKSISTRINTIASNVNKTA